MESIYQKLETIVTKELACSAHDLEHVKRVYRICLKLAESIPELDLEVLQTAALLHDIARVKEDRDDTGMIDHAELGAEMAAEILKGLAFPGEKISEVIHCIKCHRFRGDNIAKSLEAKVLFDADKLDVLGAVGIARSYILAGEYKEKMYVDIPIDEYIRENIVGKVAGGRVKDITKHATNLEYELKFKQIPDRLFTDEARELAFRRLNFMKDFFIRLKQEIDGEI